MTKSISAGTAVRKEGQRFFKFMVVGAIGFIVDAATLFFFTSIVHLPVLIAQAFSFLAAVVSNFTWNRYWTYPESRSKRIRKQLAQFTLVNLAGLAVRTLVFAVVFGPIRGLAGVQTVIALDPELLARYVTLATAVLVVLFWNFFVNRYWTYNDVG